MEDEEDGEEAVEDVVGGEHLHEVLRVDEGGVEDPRRVHPAPCYKLVKTVMSSTKGCPTKPILQFFKKKPCRIGAVGQVLKPNLVTTQVMAKRTKTASQVFW